MIRPCCDARRSLCGVLLRILSRFFAPLRPRSFHRLAEFSGSTRSCKRQLELHNARRRKAAKGAAAAAAEEAGSASSVGHVEPEDADAAADAAATLAAPPGAGGFK